MVALTEVNSAYGGDDANVKDLNAIISQIQQDFFYPEMCK